MGWEKARCIVILEKSTGRIVRRYKSLQVAALAECEDRSYISRRCHRQVNDEEDDWVFRFEDDIKVGNDGVY